MNDSDRRSAMFTKKSVPPAPPVLANDDNAGSPFAAHLQNVVRRFPPHVVPVTQDPRMLDALCSAGTPRGGTARTGNEYLFTPGGDVRYQPNLADAGTFETEADAAEARREHSDPGFLVTRASRMGKLVQ